MKKGNWVRIYDVVLKSSERSPNLPEDTKNVPLEMWNKGFLLEDGIVGEQVKIQTLTDRIVEGKLLEENPTYTHSFGKFVPEILPIGRQLKEILRGGAEDA
ncbi:2-amino-4-ketopentanoate thiolase [Isachenkonia alkalipeptolytica]|uniref:2-amino-4-ketopentanoate thiolase n=1 Tax=Isachenkonia alkalipeptolytica TaxID=2565777 RepID=A0AA44BF10_9CLOT|nr:2-amino-4-ketopentanoate thiolase [Isachenkonia alkalipeptolytica]